MQPSEARKKVLIFGNNGQLGSSLTRLLGDEEVHSFDYPKIDFLRPDQIKELIQEINPGLVINTAAYTDVDKAESDQAAALQINATTVGVIAEAAKRIGAGLIHFSTDYVFNGKTATQYHENDLPDPINFYGLSKLKGEENISAIGGSYLIFRLSWVYSMHFPSFVTKVLAWSRKNETLQIVVDQISKPSWSEMVAKKTIEVIDYIGRQGTFEKMQSISGVYHLAGGGEVTRFDWAKEILANDPDRNEQIATRIEPVESSAFPTPAERPNYTVMDCRKFERVFNLALPNWKTSLVEAMSGKKKL